jgi:hypothetical protein
VTSPLERARMLDAEMQLQRAWLALSLRDFGAAGGGGNGLLASIHPLKLGMAFLKHRSLWLVAASILANLYRRHVHKVKT